MIDDEFKPSVTPNPPCSQTFFRTCTPPLPLLAVRSHTERGEASDSLTVLDSPIGRFVPHSDGGNGNDSADNRQGTACSPLDSEGHHRSRLSRHRNRKAHRNHGLHPILRRHRLGAMVPLRFRNHGHGRSAAHLHPALDLPGSPYHHLHRGPRHHPLLHKGALQSGLSFGYDTSRRNPGLARLETETCLTSAFRIQQRGTNIRGCHPERSEGWD